MLGCLDETCSMTKDASAQYPPMPEGWSMPVVDTVPDIFKSAGPHYL
jgi:hypothetical protein